MRETKPTAAPAPREPRESPTFDFTNEEHVGLWDELPLWSAMAGLLLLDHVPLDARRVLDVGSGSGFPTLELAERLGRSGRVTGIDAWDGAVRRAARKRTTWPVGNADLVRGDAAALPFRDAAFDLIVSNLGVNNFDAVEVVLSECRRTLAAGGSLVLSTNLVGHFAELYECFGEVLEGDAAGRERLERHVGHRTRVDSLARSLVDHGFGAPSVHERRVVMRFRDGGALFEHHFIRMGFLPAWEGVAGDAQTLAKLREALDRYAAEHGELALTVPLAVFVARA